MPDVDPKRFGVTGGSGGGTQTILLGAIDPRPVVCFPQGMVSTAMQGGCVCENCSLLRIGTGNVELAALFAPKPLGMTAANDWTKEMATKGLPELERLYKLLGAKGNVTCPSLLHFPHNYNYVTRAIMYRWFNTHLKLGLELPIVEEDYRLLSRREMFVWHGDHRRHRRPERGPDYERSLTKWMDDESNRQLTALTPKDQASLAEYRELVGGAFETIVGRTLPAAGAVEREECGKTERGDYVESKELVRLTEHGEELPVVFLFPTTPKWNKQVVIWIDGAGKAALYDAGGSPRPEIRRLLKAGTTVLGADLLYQGEFLADGKPITETRKVATNPRGEYAGHTFGYNHTLFAHRVHDILTLVAFAHSGKYRPEKLHLVGLNGAGPLAAAARAIAGAALDRAVVDTGGFRFRSLKSYRDVNFLPGAVKYGDVPGLLSLSAPHKLWLAGEEGETPAIVSAAYRAAGHEDNVSSYAGKDTARAAADWLLKD
ncbi:MAG: hypothetical protein HQ582_06415 [Planctomycetes bacterium]|nr:hypothetical protein [Planctomycetota bacterium]